ncbi:MAG: hypothetical protein A2096_06280 [Spirochaetes bacterium GWF1_41_5]|nr:MAG: hypothetical protein A2096_06280 [Spirochaetes bacterium GWF1_41_5]
MSTGQEGYNGIYLLLKSNFEPWMTGEPLVCTATPVLRLLIRETELELKSNRIYKTEIYRSLGFSILWQVRRLVDEARRKSDKNPEFWAEYTVKMLETHLYTSEKLESIFSCSGLSYRQIARNFRIINRMSLKEFQLHLRIQEAKDLLRHTSLPVITIAMELNFSSSQHFAAVFRRLTGKTAREYRAHGS